MPDRHDASQRPSQEELALFDDLPPSRQQDLRARLGEDAEALAAWRRVRAALRAQLDEAVPDARLLVLLALDQAGYDDALSDEERSALDAARPALTEALERHPGLAAAVAHHRQEAEAFAEVWDKRPAERPAPARDRAARPHTQHRTSGLRRLWRASAVLTLVVAAVVIFFLVQRDASYETLEVAGGAEAEIVTLADGSTVRLVRGTLRYSTDDGFARRPELTGLAFFDVAEAEEPFVVTTPTALTTVLGTRFGVEADAAATTVALASGRVALAPREAPDRLVTLAPGEAARVARNALPTTPEAVDLGEALAWSGFTFFRDTPLPQALATLSERHATSIVLAEPLADERVTGTFSPEQPLSEILRTLAVAVDAEVVTTDGGYRLTP